MDKADDQLVLVPVKTGPCGSVAVRTGRLATGERVGLAFTSQAALAEVLGPEQTSIPLTARVARAMFADAGASETRIDAISLPAPSAVATEAAAVPVPAPAPAPAARRRSLRFHLPRLLQPAVRHAH